MGEGAASVLRGRAAEVWGKKSSSRLKIKEQQTTEFGFREEEVAAVLRFREGAQQRGSKKQLAGNQGRWREDAAAVLGRRKQQGRGKEEEQQQGDMRGRSSSKEREKKKQRRGEVRERATAEFGGRRKVEE